MTDTQKEKQKALNATLGLENRKVTKVFWSEIVDIMFTKDQPEVMLFKYKYNEDFRKATLCSNDIKIILCSGGHYTKKLYGNHF